MKCTGEETKEPLFVNVSPRGPGTAQRVKDSHFRGRADLARGLFRYYLGIAVNDQVKLFHVPDSFVPFNFNCTTIKINKAQSR